MTGPGRRLPRITPWLAMAGALLGAGCATQQAPYDYAAFRAHHPASILVLPPRNSSPDVNATPSVLAQATLPLAESGYYVIPVAVAFETFKANGLTTPDDIHAVAPAKLREIFGADAALYLEVKRYGTIYAIVTSQTIVEVDGRLVDLQSGAELWSGKGVAASDEGGNSGGLAAMLVKAALNQILANLTDQSHRVAGIAVHRQLTAGRPNGLLFGPRSPRYQAP